MHYAVIGWWLVNKYQQQAAANGFLAAAKNLRKQGVPLEAALLILVPNSTANATGRPL